MYMLFSLTGIKSTSLEYSVLCHTDGSNTIFQTINLEPIDDKWVVTNTPESTSILTFVDKAGNVVGSQSITGLATGMKLYLAAMDSSNNYHCLKFVNKELIFEGKIPDGKTVYLEVPEGTNFSWNDIRGRNWIRVVNRPLTDILKIGLSLTPFNDCDYKSVQTSLDINNSTVIIGSDCIPNCIGKKCNDDNGCGKPCGCPKNQQCDQETGKCSGQKCKLNEPCGSNGGRCPGKCPKGKTCKRDPNGRWFCGTEDTLSSTNIAIISLVCVILILLLIILILIIVRQNKSIPEAQTQLIEVTPVYRR